MFSIPCASGKKTELTKMAATSEVGGNSSTPPVDQQSADLKSSGPTPVPPKYKIIRPRPYVSTTEEPKVCWALATFI